MPSARPVLVVCLAALGACLVALSLTGLFVQTGFWAIDTAFGKPVLVCALGFGAWVVASVVAPRRGPLGPVMGILGVAGLAATMLLALLAWASSSGFTTVSAVPSPSGNAEALVREGIGIVDPVAEVRIRWSSGLLQREWFLGCWNTEGYSVEAVEVRWVTDTRVRVRFDGDLDLVADLDPLSGRPDRTTAPCA
jgi:hypothetical protein